MKKNYINRKSATAFLSIFIMLLSLAPKVSAQSFTENFEDLSLLTDWFVGNTSDSPDMTWFKGVNLANGLFDAQAGTDTSYVGANWQSSLGTLGTETLSNWFITPNRTFNNGDVITFYTRTVTNPATYADRLQVRFSGNGTSTNVGTTSATVGDFTTLLLEINAAQTTTGYPATWTQYSITISGLGGATSGRIAFRYFVTNGGPSGLNSNYIGLDTYSYTSNTSTSDATVSNVYTLGTVAKPFINPHQVKAVITNTGTVTLTNKVVTLNVTGANTFTNTQTIASLAPGATSTVTFTGYTSNNVGTNTVTVSVPADAVAIGNSIAVSQTVNTSSYNYAYGVTEDGNAGFNTVTGDVAAKFSTSSATSVSSVNVNLNSVGEPYILRIWDATGAGGTPGSLLYSSATLTSAAGIVPVTVSPSCAVNGAFFVGISQTGVNNIGLAYQNEVVVRPGSFFSTSPTGSATWADFSTFPVNFRLMIEPVFVSCTVAPAQPGTISGTATVCQGTSNTYSVAAVSGASSYTWSLPGGWTGTSTSNSITTTAGASSGSITVTATNACGTSSAQTFNVTVNPVPAQPGTISGNTTICPSSSNTYTIAAVSGATSYTWTLPGGWSGTSTTNTITALANANGGTIMVTATNACGTSTSSSLTITVSSAPPQPGAITGPTTFCSGSSNTYSITPIAGATSYTWTVPAGWSGSSTTSSITTTAGANGGTISVTYTNACGTSPAQTLSVTPGTAPAQPGAISGSTTFCPGQSQVYTIGSVANATSYNWSLPSGWSGSSTGTSITAMTGVNGGTVSVTATNSCGTSAAQTLTVNLGSAPAQPGTITGSSNICSGSNQTYSVAAVAGATSYVWTLPAGWLGGSNSTSITTITNTTSGTVTVAAVNDCGTSTVQTLTITVNAVPSQPTAISGPGSLCSGLSGVYSVPTVIGATSYNWTLPGGWSGSSTTSSITGVANGGSGNILVTVTNSCGTGPSQSLNVTVSSAAPGQPGTITGNSPICSSATTTYSVAPVSGATFYNWTLPGGWTGTSTTNSITVTVGSTGGIVAVNAANGCGTSTSQTLAVNVNQSPATPTVINGAATICAGVLQNYNVATVSGATSYTWTFPSGWVGSSITNTISSTPGISGTISVTANNSSCSSPAQTMAVTVNTAPAQPGTIAGTATVCSGATENYSVTAVSGATSYTWTMPSGWSGTSTTNSITSTVGTTGGTILVTATNSCGTSTAQSMTVTVNVVPSQPGTITGSALVCPTSLQVYSIAAVGGATSYTWTLPSGWSGSSTTNSINATAGVTGGFITVTANNGICSSAPQSLAVSMDSAPTQPGAITGSTPVCAGSTQTYSIAAVTGAVSYNWTLPGGWTGTSSTNSITVIVGTSGGNISVSATNGCGTSLAQGMVVAVNPLPAVPTITVAGNVLQSSATSGNQWNLNGNPVSGATSQFFTMTGPGFYSVTVTDANGCSSNSLAFNNTGINESELDNIFISYPNPSHDVVNIKVMTNKTVDAAYITNILGKTVKVISAKNMKANDSNAVDVKDLSQGIYFLSLQVEGRMVTRKIIVE